MKILKAVVSTLLVLFVLAPSLAAHFVFVHVVSGPHPRVEIHFSESAWDATEGPHMVEILKRVRTMLPDGQDLKFAARPWGLVAQRQAREGSSALPPVVLSQLHYGVMKRGEPFLLEYHAKGVESLAAAGRAVAERGAEIVCVPDGDGLLMTVLFDGEPVEGATVVFAQPDSTMTEELDTDPSGNLRVLRPSSSLFSVRAMIPVPGAGALNGDAYAMTKHYVTLTVSGGGGAKLGDASDPLARGLLEDAQSCTAASLPAEVVVSGLVTGRGRRSPIAFESRAGAVKLLGDVDLPEAEQHQIIDDLAVMFVAPGLSPASLEAAQHPPRHEDADLRRWVIDLEAAGSTQAWTRVVLRDRQVHRAERVLAAGKTESWVLLDTKLSHRDQFLPEHYVVTTTGAGGIENVEWRALAYAEVDGRFLPKSCVIEGQSLSPEHDGVVAYRRTLRVTDLTCRAVGDEPSSASSEQVLGH